MTFFSICITKENGDVPLAFLQASGIWLNGRALKGAFALERGHQKRQLQSFRVLLQSMRPPPSKVATS